MNWLLLSVVILVVGFSVGGFLCCRHPRIGWPILGIMILVALVLITGTAICWDAPDYDDEEPDYALLLGCALENGQPTPELIRRCETALQWLTDNEKGLLVVSGGDPGKQGRTEAAVMAAWLQDHGADQNRIILEERAADTRQNLLYSKALVRELGLETDTVLIITSEYHQTRAKFLAEQQGQHVVGLSCQTPFFDRLRATVREVYSFVKAIGETL